MSEQPGISPLSIVCVHGAWADGSSWSGVLSWLLAAGHDAVAAQLPLSSLADDVAAVHRILAGRQRVLLAGHSYGGAVITVAAAGDSRVAGLVYVSAFAPAAGESVWDLIQQGPPTPGAAAGRPDGDGRLWFDPAQFPGLFAADVDPKTARVLAAVQGPLAIACLQEPLAAAAWQNLPSWYARSTADQVIHPDAQSRMAERAGAEVTDVDGSHAALIAKPQQVAGIIVSAVEALGTAGPDA